MRVIVFNILIFIVLFNSYLLLAIKEYVAGFRAVVSVSVVRSSFDRGGLHAFDISIDLSTYLNNVCAGMICSVRKYIVLIGRISLKDPRLCIS